jgi:cytochrome c oxidase subunit II
LRQWSTNRAVLSPQRGQSTAKLGLDTSTYRGFFTVATVGFGFYQRQGDGDSPAVPGAHPILGAVIARGRAPLTVLGLLAAAFLLNSCGGVGGISPIFPTPVSPNGQGIYTLYEIISVPAIIVFIGVEAALLWVVIRYRRSKQPAGYVPPQIHGHHGLEIVWTAAPLIIVLAIAAYSFVELQKDFQPISNQDMTIVVSGHQFGWNYLYPEGFTVHQEGTLAGDVVPFVVPTHTLVKLQFQGTDVIHSWWVPAISGKTDAVPGYDNFSWLKIDQVGTWHGECAELCGAGHSTMQIIVQAMDQPQYDQWVQQQVAALASPAPSPSPSPAPAVSPSASPSPS